jgi:peptidoglycan LD-endopeptidase LytH
MIEFEHAKILHGQYIDYLAQNPKRLAIMMGAQNAPLEYIKTGEVDMAGPDWPQLDGQKLYIGGYLENRIIGATDANIAPELMRTMHIGLDLFAPNGAKVFAPIDGKVHSFKNNNNPRDYGPCIVLEHLVNNFKFYTLYGHLALRDIENLEIGQEIKAGAEFAHLGAQSENGGWPAHLHFQIILDMMGQFGDFYGLCRPDEIESWQLICPNPIEFLGLKVKNG